jgi:hypothetical protein
MTPQPAKQEPFYHEVVYPEEVRFIASGKRKGEKVRRKEIRLRIYPARLRALPLAAALGEGLLSPELEKIYARELTSRMSGYIEDACERAGLPAEAFSHVFATNIHAIIKWTFFRRYKNPDYITFPVKVPFTHIRETLSRDQKKLNADIFVRKLNDTILWLTNAERVSQVVKDYDTIDKLRSQPERFPELEQMAAPQLGTFMKSTINGIDREAQRQEGLLAVWAAAQAYRAENFASFARFLKVALKNKFCNLLRYSLATKRRANRSLSPMGGGEEGDSYMASKLEKASYAHWVEEQSAYDAIDGEVGRRIRHNGAGVLGTLKESLNGDAAAHELFDALLRGTPARQVSGADLNNDLSMTKPSPFGYWLRRKKGFPMAAFEQRARLREDGSYAFSDTLPEADDSNFPHLNEGKVELSGGLPSGAERYLKEWERLKNSKPEGGDLDFE